MNEEKNTDRKERRKKERREGRRKKKRMEGKEVGTAGGGRREADLPPQNMPLWHKDYFKLGVLKTVGLRATLESKYRFTFLYQTITFIGKSPLGYDPPVTGEKDSKAL